jgi:periplasmic divalent cation tolerance protein
MSDYRVCFVTAPPGEPAAALARALVEERLAACANIIGGIRSIYTWKGKVEDATEDLLVLKTRADLVERLVARVGELHPYEVPECIALELREGLPAYLAWIDEVTARGGA